MMRKILLTLFFCPCIAIHATDIETQDTLLQKFSDKSIPFMDRYFLTAYIDYMTIEQQIDVFKSLLPEAKKDPDKKPVMRMYALISGFYTNMFQFDLAETYLDSAFVYEPVMENHVVLGVTYYNAGIYYSSMAQYALSHIHFHKAIEHFDKAGRAIFPELYYDLSIAYKHLKDTANMRKLVDRINNKTFDQSIIDLSYSNILIYSINAAYFEILYETKPGKAFLDSMEYYTCKAIEQFRNEDNPITGLDYQVANNYLDRARIFLLKKPTSFADSALYNAQEAKRLSNPNQLMIPVGYHGIVGEIYSIEEKWDKAEQEFRSQLDLLLSKPQLNLYYEYAIVYGGLASVCEKQGKYKEAIQYQTLCLDYTKKLFDRNSYETIQELQTRYEVSKKEEDIQRLAERNQYQERIRHLMLSILGLTILMAILGFLWFKRKRKSDADALHIALLQQQEAELKAEMEKTKLEEKEVQYNALTSEMEKKQLQSYLDGLESERSRLAREMHDHVSNGLLALEIKMQSAGVPVELTVAAHHLHSQVRDLSHALMPPVFQYASLPEIIDEYIREQNKLNGPCFQFYLSPEEGWESLPHQTALDLYRIVQEACSNALKHAHAKNITVSLARKDHQIELTVADDGQGMQPSGTTGIGMRIINERVANQKGTVVVDSNPGKGTALKTVITAERP